MRREPVPSSNLDSVGYDPHARVLEVEFKSGAIWQYADVDPELATGLFEADSIGSYFAQHIKTGREARLMVRDDTTSLLDRVRGCLLGAAVGDALGAPYEFHKRPDDVDGEYHVGRFGTRPGEGTDDSALLGAVCDTLLDVGWGPRFAAMFTGRLAEWLESGPPDVGHQTAKSILHWTRYGGPLDHANPSNGSLMCVAPIGLWFTGSRSEAAEAGREFSGILHPDALSVFCCGQTAAAVSIYASGQTTAPHLDPPVGWDPSGPKMGWVAGSAGVAFQAVTTANVDGLFASLLDVIRRGGDTDTNACIAGALIGARHGVSWIPDHLLAGLADRDVWEQRAAGIATHIGRW